MVKLDGIVINNQGNAVENATVVLRNKYNSQFDLTDENGKFDFSVNAGQYEIVVLHRSYTTIRDTILLNFDSDIKVTMDAVV